MRAFLIICAFVAGGLVAVMLIGSSYNRDHPKVDVADACAGQFPGDQDAQNRCELKILTTRADGIEADKMRAAEAAAR